MALQPALQIVHDAWQGSAACVGICDLDPELLALCREHPQGDRLLQSALQVIVIEPEMRGCGTLPNVLGHYQILENGLQFIPLFPFEPGVRYRASFNPRLLGRAANGDRLTLEFSLPKPVCAEPACVTDIFPSADVLPENLLRFYVCFSHSMRRGQAEQQIRLLGADGRPAPDVLYRPPLELWDRSMRHLTVLLDPGRLKRWVGPNRELGPPLTAGQRYVLSVGSEMADSSGRLLSGNFRKPFVVTEAVREPIAVAHWKVMPPVPQSRQPLAILFPRPMDWALLWHAITIVTDGGEPVLGRVLIERNESRWLFTPSAPWVVGRYSIRVASDLEDVCGNSVVGAFERPLRAECDSSIRMTNCSIPFQLIQPAN